VVEDNKSMRMLLRRAMEQDGYQVAEAGDGEQVQYLYRLNPDICPVGCPMPVMDGFYLLHSTANTLKDNHTPVLMITSLEDQNRLSAPSVGSDDVTKPIHWAVLTRVRTASLQQSHLTRFRVTKNCRLELAISKGRRRHCGSRSRCCSW